MYFSNGFYSNKNLIVQRNIISVFGIFVMIFACFILYLTGNSGFQRPIETVSESDHEPLLE
jgi:hypothetical protein